MMLSAQVVDEIKRLLKVGSLSQRGIARRMGVSRGSVNAIALGKRPDPQTRRREGEDALAPPSGPHVRCATCGAMVQMPCLACRLRRLDQSRRRPQRGLRGDRRQGAAGEVVSTRRGEPGA